MTWTSKRFGLAIVLLPPRVARTSCGISVLRDESCASGAGRDVAIDGDDKLLPDRWHAHLAPP